MRAEASAGHYLHPVARKQVVEQKARVHKMIERFGLLTFEIYQQVDVAASMLLAPCEGAKQRYTPDAQSAQGG